MSFVLDSSVALSWCFRDEQSDESLEILTLARAQAVFVPSLWHLEMANVLGMAFRRQRLHENDLAWALRLFTTLDMHTDTASPTINTSVLLPLMQAYSLTAYDAVYLELALRLDLPLATLDRELAAASENAGVTLLGRVS